MIQYDVPMDAGRVAAIARAYLLENQLSDLLEENGGNFKVGETWCLGILKEMDYSRRKCTTQAAKLPADWEIKGKRLTLQVCDPSHGGQQHIQLVVRARGSKNRFLNRTARIMLRQHNGTKQS
jgi:hypothetical protein